MNPITAKVRLVSKEDGPETARLVFNPDYQDGRNAAWALATPTLNLTMTVKSEVAELFEPGQPYTLTFTKDEPATV